MEKMQSLEIQTNPKSVVPAEADKTIERLEKRNNMCKKIKSICSKSLTAIATAGVFAGAYALGGLEGAYLGGIAGVAMSLPLVATAYVAGERGKFIQKKIDSIRKKINPEISPAVSTVSLHHERNVTQKSGNFQELAQSLVRSR